MPMQGSVALPKSMVVAWDVPPAIVAGERFRIKVGIKCSLGSNDCGPSETSFAVFDHAGAQVAKGNLPGDLWPGTTGLYAAEIELEAPEREGLYTWSAKLPGSDPGGPRGDGSVSFGVRVVGRPEHRMKVEAIDKVSRTPIPDARVVMHPYRAVTDGRGVAEMQVAGGSYQLLVSQTAYLTLALTVEVKMDMTARAELEREPVRERN
jgi:hypothetical protein